MNDLVHVQKLSDAILQEIAKVVVGHDALLSHLLCALYARGHVLLEGVPGTAKTLMVRALAACLGADMKRVQFTPDLMPSDILGTNVFNLQAGRFHLVRGPIFTDLLLADEVNRAPAKTQSALLEAMEERRVTIDGEPHPLATTFTVFATQNPIEFEGTYPLPEAQLDRFLMKLQVTYPSEGEEDAILRRFEDGFDSSDLGAAGLRAVATKDDLTRARTAIYGSPGARSTGEGGGVRTPDDVKGLVQPVLGHRLLLDPEAEIDGLTAAEVLENVTGEVEVPR